MYFRDRAEAAELLAERLIHYQGKQPLVLGIPRGSVPMAKILASRLHGDLDVVLVHKIGAPENPEFAVGSVSEFGDVYQSYGASFYGFSPDDLENLGQKEIAKLAQRRKTYSPLRPPIDPKGRIVIIVDDGIATGSTMLAAVRAIRSRSADKIVIASPVASPEAVSLLRPEVDEVVTVDVPVDFFSISQFYENFPQVDDEEVESILAAAGRRAGKKAA